MTGGPVELRRFIRNVPDFPKPGIMFRDITPLLQSPAAFNHCIDLFAEQFASLKPTVVLGAESRGFIFAAPLALRLGAGFVPIRKPGKLPHETRRLEYALEYGFDALEMHIDAVAPGSRVLLIDDLLATGGTIEACLKLATEAGAEIVGCGFVIELTFLNGRQRLPVPNVHSLIQYADET